MGGESVYSCYITSDKQLLEMLRDEEYTDEEIKYILRLL